MAKLKATAVVASAAAVLIGLGVVVAQQTPTAAPPLPAATPVPERPLQPPPAPSTGATGSTQAPPAAGPGPLEGSVHRTANFLVIAPSAVVARAVAAEAEFQRAEIGKLWLGAPPAAWPDRCRITVKLAPGRGSGASTFQFQLTPDKTGQTGCRSAATELSGSLEDILTNELPPQVLQVVLVYHVGRPLPRWAEEGISIAYESAKEQAPFDRDVRKLLNDGDGVRLKVLFTLKEYPRKSMVTYAQGHSVVRFLMTRKPADPTKAIERATIGMPAEAVAKTVEMYAARRKTPHGALLEFIEHGLNNIDAPPLRKGPPADKFDPWAAAALFVYGFESIDALEEAWLEWLAKPESQLSPPPRPAKPKDDGSGRIPPTRLPGGGTPPAERTPPPAKPDPKPPTDVTFTSSRTFKLPIKLGPRDAATARSIDLMVSRDEGKTWAKHATLPRGKTEFEYVAPADGPYHFAVNADLPNRPPQHALMQADVKVVVDTTPPVVNVNGTTRDGDRVMVWWAAEDSNPSHHTALIQYRAKGEQAWTTVEAVASSKATWFDTAVKGALELRVVVKDAAGNEGKSVVVTVE